MDLLNSLTFSRKIKNMTGNNLIGFVGVGRMGKNMALRLKDQGYTIAALQDSNSKEANSLAQEISCDLKQYLSP